VVCLGATDPANPFGTVLAWPGDAGDGSGRPAHLARGNGAFVVLDGAELRLYLERGGRSLWTRGAVTPAHVAALLEVATRAGKVELQTVDGVPTHSSPLSPVLREAGLHTTPRGLVAWPATPS
jgi:ATP-dependent Lhr-like helicase